MSTTTKDQLEKQRDEVRELQVELQRKRLANLPNEHASTVEATNVAGDDSKTVEIDAFGGYLYVQTHGVAKLGREEAIALRKRLDRAFQVL